MRTIGVEAQFIAFATGVAKPDVFVRRAEIAAIQPRGGGCTLMLRGGAELEITEDVNVVMSILTYTPDK